MGVKWGPSLRLGMQFIGVILLACCVNAEGASTSSSVQGPATSSVQESDKPVIRQITIDLVVQQTQIMLKAKVEDASKWSWGDDGDGQLGRGAVTTETCGSDKRVCRKDIGLATGLRDIVQVSAGLNHVLVLQAGGKVWGFGSNEKGQLGYVLCFGCKKTSVGLG